VSEERYRLLCQLLRSFGSREYGSSGGGGGGGGGVGGNGGVGGGVCADSLNAATVAAGVRFDVLFSHLLRTLRRRLSVAHTAIQTGPVHVLIVLLEQFPALGRWFECSCHSFLLLLK
jgi:hypothetical protein